MKSQKKVSTKNIAFQISICAVLVTYNPKKKLLKKLIQALSHQVNRIVIVDNSESHQNQFTIEINKNLVHIIKLGSNKGIATAQNEGIKWARTKKFSHVLLMDQDSLPARHMVFDLSQALLSLEHDGKQVAAVGPLCYVDGNGTVEPFLIRRKITMRRVQYQKCDRIYPVESLMASGSLISLQTLDIIGMLEESLFIDFIDTEWAFRALSKGYRCYVACQARLDHHLGDTSHKNLFGRCYKIVRHPPERYYYQFRNALLLFKKPYIPSYWIVYQIYRQMIPRFILQATIISSQRQNLTMMIIGMWHGLLSITGPYRLKVVCNSRV